MSNGGGRQICDIEDQNGEFLFQERSYFPHSWLKKITIRYIAWRNAFTSYKELMAAKVEFGAEMTLKDPYCDDSAPWWYLTFDDADKCAHFVATKLGYEWEWMGEDKEKSREPEEAVA